MSQAFDASTFFTHGFISSSTFTDRIEPQRRFADFVGASLSSSADALDLVLKPMHPRRNVLAYYGLGGIGKTALLQQLVTNAVDLCDGHVATVTIDYEASAWSTEDVIKSIRGALASLDRKWEAFDSVHVAYWAKRHPGIPIAEFIKQQSIVQRQNNTLKITDQLEGILDNVLGSYGTVGLGWRASRAVYSTIRGKIDAARLSASCPLLGPCLSLIDQNETTDRTFAFLGSLLAWRLAELQNKAGVAGQVPPQLVVFLDAWENVQILERRALENVIMHLVHSMPNVLFVIASRDQLDWSSSDRRAQLALAGPNRWPDLTPELQCRIDTFGSDHARTYLTSQIESEQVVDRILAHPSSGMPFYLHLSALQYGAARASGGEVDPDAFGKTLPEVVYEIMADRSSGERILARIASLLDRFDLDILQAAAPYVDGADMHRFLASPLVDQDHLRLFPYSMSRPLAEMIRECDVHYSDRWPAAQWENVAKSLMARLMERSRVAFGPAAEGEIFLLAVKLLRFVPGEPDWLIESAERLAVAKESKSLMWASARMDDAAHIRALSQGFQGMGMRITGMIDEARGLLETAIAESELGTLPRGLFSLYLGRMLLESGDATAARECFRAAIVVLPRHRFEARRLAAWSDIAGGKFKAASEELAILRTEVDGNDRTRAFEVTVNEGHLLFFNARHTQAEERFHAAAAIANESASESLIARATVYLAECLAWTRPENASEIIERALQMAENIGDRRDILVARTAKVVGLAGTERRSDFHEAVDAALTAAGAVNSPWRHLQMRTALVLDAALRLDQSAVDRQRSELSALSKSTNAFAFWREIAVDWMASPGHESATAVAWTDSGAPGRWRELYLSRLTAGLGLRAGRLTPGTLP